MGLKEDMEGDLALASAAATGKAKPSVRKRVELEPTTPKHMHGEGALCEVAYFDDDNRRRVRVERARVPPYVFNCKACIAEDKARMEAPPEDIDFDSTIFLIPESAPDATIAQVYLAKRYPGVELAALSTIRPARLAIRKGAQLVVVTRRALPGKPCVGPMTRLIEDKRGDMVETPVPPEEHLAEIVESAPIVVDDCVKSTAATMFSDAVVDLTELNLRLCDVASPRYYIAQYQRTPGSDELVFTMRALSN